MAGYIQRIRLEPDVPTGGYPFSLPVVTWLAAAGGLELPPGVTFLVGENGSGKSTLIEAIAVAAGFNPEGGSQNFRFASRASESALGGRLIVSWGARKPRSRFFLRAESFYNVATEMERLDDLRYSAARSHERSHGESFLDLITDRFWPRGLYLMDEPEAALSVRGCMAALARFGELVEADCQLIVATHSPILLALPGATILEIGEDGSIGPVGYDDALPVRLTREFLAAPDKFVRYLLD